MLTITDEVNGPKTINDVKLINAGKILENDKTLAESRSPVSEVPGGIITMLVVVRPHIPHKNNGNQITHPFQLKDGGFGFGFGLTF